MNPQAIIDKYISAVPINNDFISKFGRFGDIWNNTWEPTATAAARQEAVSYVNPLRRTAQQQTRSDLANRGMFRSSLLGRDLGEVRKSYDRQRDIRTESGRNTRQSELRNAYDSLMRVYEEDPTGAGKTFKQLINSYKA